MTTGGPSRWPAERSSATTRSPVAPALLLLAAGAFVIGTDAFLIAALLRPIAEDLRVRPATAGLLVPLFTFSYGAAAPLLTARPGGRLALRRAMLVFSAGALLTSLAPWFWLAAAGRVVTAIGAAGYTPRALALAAATADERRRGRALATVTAGLSLATAVGLPLGATLGTWVTWRAALAGLAVLGLALVPVLPHAPPAAGPRFGLRSLGAVTRRPVPALLAVTLLVLMAEYVVYTYITVVFAGAAGAAEHLLSPLLLGFGVGAVAGSVLAGRATDRFGGRAVSVVAISLMGVCCLAMVVTSGRFWPALVTIALWGGGGWAFAVPQQHRLLAGAPGRHGPALMATNSAVLYLGASIGGLLGGGLLTFAGAAVLAPVASAIGLLAAATAGIIRE